MEEEERGTPNTRCVYRERNLSLLERAHGIGVNDMF